MDYKHILYEPGKVARTTLARKNYEASKEYLAAKGLLPPDKK